MTRVHSSLTLTYCHLASTTTQSPMVHWLLGRTEARRDCNSSMRPRRVSLHHPRNRTHVSTRFTQPSLVSASKRPQQVRLDVQLSCCKTLIVRYCATVVHAPVATSSDDCHVIGGSTPLALPACSRWSRNGVRAAAGHCVCSFTGGARVALRLPAFGEAVEIEAFSMDSKLVAYAIVPAAQRHKQALVPWSSAQADSSGAAVDGAAAICGRLAMWASNLLHRMHGQPEPWGLAALPLAVVSQVMLRCDRDSLLAVACTCRALRRAADDDAVWSRRYQQDWKSAPEKVRFRRGNLDHVTFL